MDNDSWQWKDEFWFNVTFIYRTSSDGEDDIVYLGGDFNGWNTGSHQMQPCPEGYSITLPLSEGFYHYKFLVCGRWLRDEHNPHRGGEHDNSIMFVHMDPNVYGIRPQYPPHRDYHRPLSDGGQFQIHCPKIPPNIASYGVLERLIFVYLPPSYYLDTNTRYPVLYVNDGQNIFSTPGDRGGPCCGGWYMDAILDHFWSEKLLPEFIVVGVPNADFVCIGNRNREYCTSQFNDTSHDPYIKYLIEVVKATIDESYRTLSSSEHTFTLGSSMGGLCSFVLAVKHCEVFSAAICMSPSFWYVDQYNESAFDLVRGLSNNEKRVRCKVYIDSGDGLGDNCYETALMAGVLEECGWQKGREFKYHLDKCQDKVDMGNTHSESVWKERLLLPLQFVFNTSDSLSSS